MAILKKEYELSVWDETLGEKGQKEEIKRAIIGAHDMDYLGRATSLKLSRKINGTNTLTFQLPSKYFDSELGEYVHNEFCDYLFNERKLKLKYDGEWFEFYVKSVSENKQFKSIMYQYSCEDAFIDELSRNGYGITFDTELYNNVEEIGIFTEQILEDSIWEYDASKNWGDFTEYAEEKLFKIPVSMFKTIVGHKLNYEIEGELKNVYTGQTRPLELGDDLAREGSYFWDNGTFDKGIELLSAAQPIENDGYIYVPYSCLGFCYTPEENGYVATETAKSGTLNNITSYYLAPQSIDPTSLIQFIAIPSGAEVQIDEAGLLVNKNYSYVMTLKEWNDTIETGLYYDVENKVIKESGSAICNKIVCYEGYLENIGDIELTFGKKISVTDRTEINISKDIDQYVTVYNNKQEEYISTDKEKNNITMFTSDEWRGNKDYRICSYERTRTIVPQLARNLVQNGTEISDISGWEVMKVSTVLNDISSKINLRIEETEIEDENLTAPIKTMGLIFDTNNKITITENEDLKPFRTFLNFGILGQEEKIEKDQTYVLCIKGSWCKYNEITDSYSNADIPGDDLRVIIGEGNYDSNGNYIVSENKEERISFRLVGGENSSEENKIKHGDLNNFYFIKPTINIENPYFCIQVAKGQYFNLTEAYFFKAFTKGMDFFSDGYYKYTGRDIFFNEKSKDWIFASSFYYRLAAENEFIKETDVVEGDVYVYKKYFRQQIQYKDKNDLDTEKDTFMLKSYLNNEVETNGLDPRFYTEDDYKIITDYIDLNKCLYYNHNAAATERDCEYVNGNGVCMYQKYGYCPYLFKTQKHCRKIRTLNGEKSNRFNLTQELSKVFEVYPVYYIDHEENGKIKKDKNNRMIKKIFYITEKGMENKLGFRYEKNLSNISRTLDSKEIVTKLYVEDIDSELSKTGLCSIKTAEDNPSKDSYIIDFSYYTMKGLLNAATTEADLYGIDGQDLGYLKQLGYYNSKYDEISNKIINLQDASYTELQANIEVNLTGIETAQQEMNKIKKTLSRYAQPKNILNNNTLEDETLEESDTYKSYKIKYNEQRNILLGLIESTFLDDKGNFYNIESDTILYAKDGAQTILKYIDDHDGFKQFKKEYLDTFKYKKCGMMGQYTEEYLQIQEWKKEKAKYLKDINKISLDFYQKYEPYLKEGTWSDSNYLSDNAYYFGAKEVAKQGAIPKVTYSISVVDLAVLDEDYIFNIADTTYVEDIETFGVNPKTGLPNRLKVIISGITYDLDIPTKNTIEIQNYTSQFEDLFQQVTASVQSLSFNENIYKRSSNFTSTQNVSGDSLQGGLSNNQLTLLETNEKNIELDYVGQRGSDINNHNNKYKLTGEGLFFSNNGGQTWNVGVTPKGINADYINVGTLDASKIQIVDGNYLYFLWDKSGITAYRSPQATQGSNYFADFAKFNKYGLSLVEDGKIRLRAGYEYVTTDSTANGDIAKELDFNNNTPMEDEDGNIYYPNQLRKIGFYLYNKNGDAIFKTETSNEEDKDLSARISLAGEMYVSDSLEQTISPVTYEYSNPIVSTQSAEALIVKSIEYSALNPYLYASTEDGEILRSDLISVLMGNKIEEKEYLYNEENGDISKITFSLDRNETDQMLIYDGEDYYKIIRNILKLFKNKGEESQEDYSEEIYYNDSITPNELLISTSNTQLVAIYSNTVLNAPNIVLNKRNFDYYSPVNRAYTNTKVTYESKNVAGYLYSEGKQATVFNNVEIINEENKDIEDSIGIFINNQSINSEIKTYKGYERRLFCCAKRDINGDVKNIFSILRNGTLYIGGDIKTPEENNSLSDLSDYIQIDEEDPNVITLTTSGTLKIGGSDLLKYLSNEIEKLTNEIKNLGLITHNHDLSGAKVTSVYPINPSEGHGYVMTFSESASDDEDNHPGSLVKFYNFGSVGTTMSLPANNLYVCCFSADSLKHLETGDSGHIYFYPLNTFFSEGQLQILDGESSGTAGLQAGPSVSTTAYYVEEDI